MKGTRPLDNDETRRVSTCFTGTFATCNHGLFMLGVSTGGRISELLSLCISDVWQNDTAGTDLPFEKSIVKGGEVWTATGNLGHSLNQECDIIAIYLKEVSDGETQTQKLHARVSGPKLFLRHSEEIHLNDHEDIHEVRVRIGQFITQVHHQKRPHSALGYLTPMDFEQQNLGAV